MRTRITGVKGPTTLAEHLREWARFDSPDLTSATVSYIAEQWLKDDEATLERVRALCAELRRIGAAGDADAAMIACELECFLERHGHLQWHWADRPHDSRADERTLHG
jgi:hypothetical protein